MATVVGVIVKAFVPGSMEFLLLGIVCGLLLRVLRPSLKRVTAAWMASLAIFYLVLSLPWTAKRLAEPLYFYPPVTGPADALGASTLVVLHGDHEGLRVQETFRLYELLLPQRVIVLAGGPRMRDALLGTGIPWSTPLGGRLTHHAGTGTAARGADPSTAHRPRRSRRLADPHASSPRRLSGGRRVHRG